MSSRRVAQHSANPWIGSFLLTFILLALQPVLPGPQTLAQEREKTTGCLELPRGGACTFTVIFDASTERFISISASRVNQKNGEKAIVPTETVSLPLRSSDLPILTGDVVLVEIQNATIGDRVELNVSSEEVTTSARPSIGQVGLPRISLTSFATPSIGLATENAKKLPPQVEISSADFKEQPAAFAQIWRDRVRDRLAGTLVLRKEFDKIAPSARRNIVSFAEILGGRPGTRAVELVESVADDLVKKKDQLSTKCPPKGIAQDRESADACLQALYSAASVAASQSTLRVALGDLVGTLPVSEASTVLAQLKDVVESRLAREARAYNSQPAKDLAGPGMLSIPALPANPTPIQQTETRTALAVSDAVRSLAAPMTASAYVGTLEVKDLRQLRANVLYANADFQSVVTFRLLIGDIESLIKKANEAIKKLQKFSAEFEPARVELAVAATEFAFEFDRATNLTSPTETRRAFSSAGDEILTIELSRFPRFAASRPGADVTVKDVKAPKATGGLASVEVKPRKYKFELRARRRHHFQVIAGLGYATNKSKKFGAFDFPMPDDTPSERRITASTNRPKKFFPMLQLVWNPGGKDLHPDAYRGWSWLKPSPVFGVGLDDPTQSFTLGAAFEPKPGLHVSLGVLWSQEQRLQPGFEIGDVLPPGGEPPVEDVFESGLYFTGLVDIGVFANFLGSLFK